MCIISKKDHRSLCNYHDSYGISLKSRFCNSPPCRQQHIRFLLVDSYHLCIRNTWLGQCILSNSSRRKYSFWCLVLENNLCCMINNRYYLNKCNFYKNYDICCRFNNHWVLEPWVLEPIDNNLIHKLNKY